MMILFAMPQGEILNDGSACDVANIRAGWEKIFSLPQNFWLRFSFSRNLNVVNKLFFTGKYYEKIFNDTRQQIGNPGCTQCIQFS